MKSLDDRTKQDILEGLDRIAKETHILDGDKKVEALLCALGYMYDITLQQQKEFKDYYNERQVAYTNES